MSDQLASLQGHLRRMLILLIRSLGITTSYVSSAARYLDVNFPDRSLLLWHTESSDTAFRTRVTAGNPRAVIDVHCHAVLQPLIWVIEILIREVSKLFHHIFQSLNGLLERQERF
jgi:hypothetical protein